MKRDLLASNLSVFEAETTPEGKINTANVVLGLSVREATLSNWSVNPSSITELFRIAKLVRPHLGLFYVYATAGNLESFIIEAIRAQRDIALHPTDEGAAPDYQLAFTRKANELVAHLRRDPASYEHAA